MTTSRPIVEQKYIDYWKAREAKYEAQCKLWEKEAWVEVEAIAKLLQERFGATKIVVFGSLVKDRFGEDSDIDIAVEGIDSKSLWDAYAEISQCSQRFIDLKAMEKLDPYFKKRVLETGKVLEERDRDEEV